MRRAAHIVVLAVVLAGLCACSHRGRVIPENKFARIYHDMFLADQWVRDHPEAREAVDTTLLFDPIFERYGYSFEDYDRSVQYYLDHVDRYFKLLGRVETQLRKEGDALQLEADRLAARDVELSKFRQNVQWRDFSTDSLRWAGARALWPVDSLVQADASKVSLMPETLLPVKQRPFRKDLKIKLNETE